MHLFQNKANTAAGANRRRSEKRYAARGITPLAVRIFTDEDSKPRILINGMDVSRNVMAGSLQIIPDEIDTAHWRVSMTLLVDDLDAEFAAFIDATSVSADDEIDDEAQG